mgnify:CR=1 FL=1
MADLSFDDLVPRRQDKASSLSFDDLIVGAKRKVGAVEDATRSFVSGARKGVSGIADNLLLASPVGQTANALTWAAGMADTMRTGHLKPPAAPIAPFTQNALRDGYKPQTTGGRYAEAIGENLPNALVPGGLVRRAANVVLPAVASQGAADVAHAAGAGPGLETAARVAGAAGGAILASSNPRALLKPKAAPRPPAPTLEELSAQRDAAYKAVDESGATYSPEAFNDLVMSTAQKMDAEGFHAGLHPKAAQMMERINASQKGIEGGYSPTLSQLDQLRQQIGRDVAASADPGERRMGQIMRDQIDEFIANAAPEGAEGAGDLITRARDLHARVSKLKALDGLDEAAADRAASTGTGGNIENATRQNVRRFADKTKNLSEAERAAAKKVVRGTPAGNALRQVGRLSPEGNGVMAGIHLLGAVPSHGMTVPVAGAGFIARRVSDALTQKNVQALRDLIATGGEEAVQEVTAQLAAPQYADVRRQLSQDLAQAMSVSTAANPMRAGAPVQTEPTGSGRPTSR